MLGRMLAVSAAMPHQPQHLNYPTLTAPVEPRYLGRHCAPGSAPRRSERVRSTGRHRTRRAHAHAARRVMAGLFLLGALLAVVIPAAGPDQGQPPIRPPAESARP